MGSGTPEGSSRIRTPISITRLVKLKLGDTFRAVIHHNERHILQAKRVVKTIY